MKESAPGVVNQKFITIMVVVAILVLSLLSLFLAFGPEYYHGELGWRTIHSRMIARDLSQNNFNIFNTSVYCRGEKIAYVQGLPVYELAVAVLYTVFGEHIILARLVSIAAFAVALVLFYLFSLNFLSKLWALFAMVLFGSNFIVLSFSYQIQPTSVEIMLLLFTLHYFTKYLRDAKMKHFILWSGFVALLSLSKITYGCFTLLPIAIVLLLKYRKSLFKQTRCYVFAFSFMVINFSWYYYAMGVTHPVYQKSFTTYFTDVFNWIFNEGRFNYVLNLYKWAGNTFLTAITLVGLTLFIVGFIAAVQRKKPLLYSLFISYLLLWALLPYKFFVHPYNFMLLMIPAVILISMGIGSLFNARKKFCITLVVETESRTNSLKLMPGREVKYFILIIFLVFFAISNYIALKKLHSHSYDYIKAYCGALENYSKEDEKVVIGARFVGTNNIWQNELLYESNRKGWPLSFPAAFSPSQMMYFVNRGASKLCLISNLHMFKYDELEPYYQSAFNWLYGTFTFIDGYYDSYHLFDLSKMNKFEQREQTGLKCDLRYDEYIKLLKIRGIYNHEKSRIELKFLWKSLKGNIPFKFDLLAVGNDDISQKLYHTLMGKMYNSTYWIENRKYSEWIMFQHDPTVTKTWKFVPVLFAPNSQKLVYPSQSNYKLPMITIIYDKGELTLKMQEADSEGYNKVHQKLLLKKATKLFHVKTEENFKYREIIESPYFTTVK